MENIRIIEIPKLKMISSGFGSLEELKTRNFERLFPDWKHTIFPPDFMSYDSERKQMIWYLALTEGMKIDPGEFEVIDHEGGLYAAGVSIDEHDTDGTRVYNGIKEWVAASGIFELDERPGHYTMFHISTSPNVQKALGYNQLEIFVPIKAKTDGK